MAGPQYLGIERYIFADTYNFFLKYKDMPNNDYNWELCIEDANKLLMKYKKHPLVRTIVSEVMYQIEHCVKSMPIDGLTHEAWEVALVDAHKMGW